MVQICYCLVFILKILENFTARKLLKSKRISDIINLKQSRREIYAIILLILAIRVFIAELSAHPDVSTLCIILSAPEPLHFNNTMPAFIKSVLYVLFFLYILLS